MKQSIAFAFCMALVLAVSSFGQKNVGKAADRANQASKVLNEIMKEDNTAIPNNLLQKAKAIVVFPGTVKAGFIFGGQGGHGVAVRRMGNSWSAPAFLKMAGGSVGFQIGAEKTDYILLVMNDGGLNGLLEDKFEVGGEGSVAAGPVGRTAAASTNATLDAEILSWSRSKGAFAGLSLKGVVISPDNDLNNSVLKKNAKEILGSPGVDWSSAPKQLQGFPKTVAMHTK